MGSENSIGQELAKIPLRPAIYDELGHEVQVGAWIDIVSDAGGDDAEDGCGTLAADVEPGEEPIFAAETKPSQFTLAAIIRELDVAVFEEQGEA